MSTLDDVRKILARWFIRELAKILDVSLKELSLVTMKRTVAEHKAKAVIEASPKDVDAVVATIKRKQQ